MSFSLSSAPEQAIRAVSAFIAVLALVLVGGCGSGDFSSTLESGRAALERNDLDGADRAFAECEQMNPGNVDLLLHLTRLKLRLGEVDTAAKYIARAESVAADDVDVRLLDAEVAWYAREYDRAIRGFSEIAEDPSLSAELRSQALSGMGVVQMGRSEAERPGTLDLARLSLMRAIRLNRRNAAAWYHLGCLYQKSPFDYPDAAIDQFRCFVRLDGDTKRAATVKDSLIPGLEAAIAQRKSALKGSRRQDAAGCAAALNKAEASIKKGELKAALRNYGDALAADPLSGVAALGVARTQLKLDTTKAGRQTALKAYGRAGVLKLGEWDESSLLMEMGEVAENAGSYATARTCYSHVLALNMNSVKAVDGMIRSLQKANAERSLIQSYRAYRELLSQGR